MQSQLVRYPQMKEALLQAIEIAELSAVPSLSVQIAHGIGMSAYASRINGMMRGYTLPLTEEAEALNHFFHRITDAAKRTLLPDFMQLATYPLSNMRQARVA